MQNRDYQTSADFLKRLFGETLQKVELRACANERDGSARSIFTRDAAEIEAFCQRHDQPGSGTYFGVCTRGERLNDRGGISGSKDNVVECPALWVDIDCAKAGIAVADALTALNFLPSPPSIILNSGGGLHAYWVLEEPIQVSSPAAYGPVEAVLRQLALVLAGDTTVAEVARIMRLPGTFNSKPATCDLNGGEPVEVTVLEDRGTVHDFQQLAEWLSEQRAVLHLPAKAGLKPVDEADPFAAYARQAGYEPSIDIDAELVAMNHGAIGNASIHQTQLRVSASMIARGYEDDEIVARILAATEAAAPGDKQWNWGREERAIAEMVRTGRAKGYAKPDRERSPLPRVAGNTALKIVSSIAPEEAAKAPKPTKAEQANKNEISVLGGATLSAWIDRYGPIMHSAGGSYVYEEGVWSVWDNRHDQMLRSLLQEGCARLNMKPATSLLNAATRFVMDHPDYLVRDVEFDQHDLIVAEDGCLNLTNMTVVAHSPDHHAKFRIGASLRGERACASLSAFLKESFSDHTPGTADAIISTLQEWFGAALVANKPRSLRKGLLVHGGSRTGKTQISEILRALLGKGLTTAIKVRDLDKDFGTETLLGKRGWIADDAVGQGETLDAETYKVLVTGEAMSVRRKNKGMIDGFRFACPVCLTMNNLPKIKDGSDAVYNRSIILPMTKVRPEAAPEPAGYDSIAEKIIAEELTGVLWWAIEGWQRLRTRGVFSPPPCMAEAIRDLQEMNDDVGTWVRQCIEVDARYQAAPADLFASFAGWFFQEKGDTKFGWSQNGFSRKFKERVPSIGSGRNGRQRWLTGVRLNEEGLENWTVNAERDANRRTTAASVDAFSVNVLQSEPPTVANRPRF